MRRYRLLLILVALLLGARVALAEGGEGPRAGLVIVGETGEVHTYCVAFEGETLGGLALLERASVEVTVQRGGGGTAVCAIDGLGCPPNDCFCACKGTPCAYWSYFHRDADSAWAYSGVGVGAWQLRDGDVDGWVWGDGSAQPPALSFTEICPEAEVVFQPLPDAGGTPLPTPEATYQVFLPMPAQTAAPATGSSGPIPAAWLRWGRRYGSFVLLLLALAAWVWLQRAKRRGR